MSKSALNRFLDLARSVNQGRSVRSENDLSRHLAAVLEELGLHSVLDTTSRHASSRKRPDILVYTNFLDADLVLAADVVIEAKKPGELDGSTGLSEAMLNDFWEDKTLPYIQANLSRIRYFCFTSFTDFSFLRITPEIRQGFLQLKHGDHAASRRLAALCGNQITRLSLVALGSPGEDEAIAAWRHWITIHLSAESLADPRFSELRDTIILRETQDLESLAGHLAELAAGPETSASRALQRNFSGLFDSIRSRLPTTYEEINPQTRQDLHLFVMVRNPAADLSTVGLIIKENPTQWLDDFVGASIHSLISRLFALDVIEDVYCLDAKKPLLERKLWVMHRDEYDGLGPEDFRRQLFQNLGATKDSANRIIRHLSFYGAFFDWIELLIDPLLLRKLFELVVSCDFREIEGDLLGRFFELYSQRINRAQRRALGQYYTPLAVVRFMWYLVEDLISREGEGEIFTVLDPAMGSGTFLAEGATVLARLGLPNPWENLIGFDISPQSMGIAQVNVYMAFLRELKEEEARSVGELRLYTTDSLDPRNGKYLQQIAPLFADARHREFIERSVEVSAGIKKNRRFALIIGNPPYKNNSNLTLSDVASRFPRLLRSSADAAQAQERNIRDDYAWFFAAADYYGDDQRTIICFITSDSYARKQSYRFFRSELIRHYRILKLVRLGTGIFSDVGPRISFAIILMERRPSLLRGPEDGEAFEFVDLRAGANTLDSSVDDRLALLGDIICRAASLPSSTLHNPEASHNYSFIPFEKETVGRVLRDSAPIFSKKDKRLFSRKWPGIITAFDTLFKGGSKQHLAEKMETFFNLCHVKRDSKERRAALEDWASRDDVAIKDLDRLCLVADQTATSGIRYSLTKVKRSFSGSIPNELRWYPPTSYQHWLYYEPSLHIPRNINPGKNAGWGYMDQWRDPESHLITPKLVFTTSANPAYGFKAFVLDDEWYVKLHGGTSQQYNYTGLTDPTRTMTLNGRENNLDACGEIVLQELEKAGGNSVDLLHLIAGIYNSSLAIELLEEETGHDLQIRLPSKGNRKLARTIAGIARKLRDLHKIRYECPTSCELGQEADLLAPRELLLELGAQPVERGGRRFKSSTVWQIGEDVFRNLEASIRSEQEHLDNLVDRYYS